MKNFLLIALSMVLLSCSKTPSEKAADAIEKYLSENLKNPSSYLPVSFSSIDTLKNETDSSLIAAGASYVVHHIYNVTNTEKEVVPMSNAFFIDKEMQVVKTGSKSINGEYGTLAGSAYWKYNNFVGNRPDAGAKVKVYPLDSIRKGKVYETVVDVQGKYTVNNILPGNYFIVITSKAATDCPDEHLRYLKFYKSELKSVFNFDLNDYQEHVSAIDKLQREYESVLLDSDRKKYGGISNQIARYTAIERQLQDESDRIISTFPKEFRSGLPLYTGYSNANDLETEYIDERETSTITSDFGITCL